MSGQVSSSTTSDSDRTDDEPKPAEQGGLHKWVGIVGLFVAPTTIITGLCYYFGYLYTSKEFAYFGIDCSAIGFSTGDYVLRSVSVLYVPVLMFAFSWLSVLWGAFYIRRIILAGKHVERLRRFALVAIAVGVTGVVRGVLGMTVPLWAWPHNSALTPIALGTGATAIVVGSWLLAATRRNEAPSAYAPVARASLAGAVAMIVLALFWITGNLATRYGEEQAKSQEARLWTQETAVVIDTSERLNAPSPLIRETELDTATPGRGIRFRYRCFRVLAVKGDRWVLVPAAWEPPHGYALMLSADSSVRVSFTKHAGIAQTRAGDWNASAAPDGWPCPEVGPQ